MTTHAIIEDGATRNGSKTRGCAACQLPEDICAKHPECSGDRMRVYGGNGFDKTQQRRSRRRRATKRKDGQR